MKEIVTRLYERVRPYWKFVVAVFTTLGALSMPSWLTHPIPAYAAGFAFAVPVVAWLVITEIASYFEENPRQRLAKKFAYNLTWRCTTQGIYVYSPVVPYCPECDVQLLTRDHPCSPAVYSLTGEAEYPAVAICDNDACRFAVCFYGNSWSDLQGMVRREIEADLRRKAGK